MENETDQLKAALAKLYDVTGALHAVVADQAVEIHTLREALKSIDPSVEDGLKAIRGDQRSADIRDKMSKTYPTIPLFLQSVKR